MKKILLVLSVTLVALCLAEGSYRVWLNVQGTPHDSAGVDRELGEVLRLMTGVVPETAEGNESGGRSERGLRYTLHPYTAFTLNANLDQVENAVRHFREEKEAGGAGDYDIFVLGGSVASIFCGQEGGTGWLVDQLEADPLLEGRRVRIHRLAIPGYKQPQQLTGLAYLLSRGCRPDLVINLDGLNEVRQGVRNAMMGVQPSWPSVGHWAKVTEWGNDDSEGTEILVEVALARRRAREIVDSARTFRVHHSALASRLVLSRLQEARSEWSSGQLRYTEYKVQSEGEARNRPFGVKPDKEGALEEAVDGWYESSMAIQALCASRGIAYLHLLQPTLHDEGSKPVSAEEQRKGIGERGYDVRITAGYPLLRAGIEELGVRGIRAIDLSMAFADIEETLYYDECHFNRRGNLVLAEQVLPLILDLF